MTLPADPSLIAPMASAIRSIGKRCTSPPGWDRAVRIAAAASYGSRVEYIFRPVTPYSVSSLEDHVARKVDFRCPADRGAEQEVDASTGARRGGEMPLRVLPDDHSSRRPGRRRCRRSVRGPGRQRRRVADAAHDAPPFWWPARARVSLKSETQSPATRRRRAIRQWRSSQIGPHPSTSTVLPATSPPSSAVWTALPIGSMIAPDFGRDPVQVHHVGRRRHGNEFGERSVAVHSG